jgi:putative polyhydroxyalkanoate system protein
MRRTFHEPVPMSTIDIHHPHSLPATQARKAVEEVAEKLDARFGMQSRWEGDVLHFSRSGVDGHIALGPKELHVTAQLGFLLSAMKGSIEQEIRRVLSERFA